MKKCPFCAEEIQDEAVKCRFCGERLDKDTVPGEKVLFETHPSSKSYFWLICLGILTAVIVVGLFILLYVYLDRRGRHYMVTSRRVTAKKGILTKSVDEVSIAHIRSMNVKQDFWGRVMNYGNISIGTAGTEGVEVSIEGVLNPVSVKELIARQGNPAKTADND